MHGGEVEHIDFSSDSQFVGLSKGQKLRAIELLSRGSSLRSVNLSGLRLCDSVAPALCNLLRSAHPLQALHLDRNSLNERGLILIAAAVSSSKTLEHLSVTEQRIDLSSNAAMALGKAMQETPTMVYLRLGYLRDPTARIAVERIQSDALERRRARRLANDSLLATPSSTEPLTLPDESGTAANPQTSHLCPHVFTP